MSPSGVSLALASESDSHSRGSNLDSLRLESFIIDRDSESRERIRLESQILSMESASHSRGRVSLSLKSDSSYTEWVSFRLESDSQSSEPVLLRLEVSYWGEPHFTECRTLSQSHSNLTLIGRIAIE